MLLKRIGDIALLQLSDTDSNIYVIGDTVVDTGTGFNFPLMRKMFKAMKKDMDNVKEVIFTHSHFDHIGGAGYFFEAKVAAHENAVPIIEKADVKLTMADFFNGDLKPRKIDKKLKDGDKIKAGKYNFQVIHTPGHTEDSIVLYDEKNKLAITGDTIFSDGIGKSNFANSNPDDLRKSLEKLAGLKIDKYLPGHGDIVDKMGAKRIKTLLDEADKLEPVNDEEL